jgi:predicted DNA-binding protein (MmcQ/YjbR family)
MHIDQLRKFCLSLPAATEQIQWGDNLLFKVGGRMFAIASLEPSPVWLSLKADPEEFAELTERPGVIPAPYLARAKWIALESQEALSNPELEALLRKSYDLVLAKLPRKLREKVSVSNQIGALSSKKSKPRSKKVSRKKSRRY